MRFDNQLTPEDWITIDGAPIFPRHKQILRWFLTGIPIHGKQITSIRNDPECLIVMQNILGDRYPTALALLNQERILTKLPTAASNLQDRGNGWYSFEMYATEKKKRFLVHVVDLRGGEVGISNVTVAE